MSAEGGERVSASINESCDMGLDESREAVETPSWGWERQQVRWLQELCQEVSLGLEVIHS